MSGCNIHTYTYELASFSSLARCPSHGEIQINPQTKPKPVSPPCFSLSLLLSLSLSLCHTCITHDTLHITQWLIYSALDCGDLMRAGCSTGMLSNSFRCGALDVTKISSPSSSECCSTRTQDILDQGHCREHRDRALQLHRHPI